MILLPNMNWFEQIELQISNKFFYETAISRVCTNATLSMIYFTWDKEESKNFLYQIHSLSMAPKKLERIGLDLTNCMTVQVR